jgi:UMF1 family MFS transporter
METVSPTTIQIKKKKLITTRRERWSWYFYDFGNSAYAAVILLAVYSAYFKQQVVGGAEGSRLWGVSISIATFVVAIVSPLLGAMADFSATKKRMLFAFTSMACIFTACLFFVQKGDIITGMVFFIIAEIGYRSGQVFYNALLPEIAKPDEMGRVSGFGWAIGSLGGIVCLLLVLALIQMIGGNFVLHSTFVITAIFYGVATTPLFIFLRERNHPSKLPPGETYFSVSVGKLWHTFKNARRYKNFMKFLLAFLIYNNGIMITLDFAAIIGATLFGMTQTQLIIFMIIVQVTSVIGAYVFGFICDRLGDRTTLVIAIALMILTVSGLFVVKSLFIFNLIGAMAGFSLTGVQSVSRTAVGKLTPEDKSAEFYGLFSVSGQISAFLGPLVYGQIVAWLANTNMRKGMESIAAEEAGLRLAVTLIIAFLVAGMALLFSIRNWQPHDEKMEA